ncbi:hypothetical protein C8R42DRAFT_110917 [Lentinula raphanica]|nr:hypothetical protein C8R42DRAFT_110917 [Lentinula raphanica]
MLSVSPSILVLLLLNFVAIWLVTAVPVLVPSSVARVSMGTASLKTRAVKEVEKPKAPSHIEPGTSTVLGYLWVSEQEASDLNKIHRFSYDKERAFLQPIYINPTNPSCTEEKCWKCKITVKEQIMLDAKAMGHEVVAPDTLSETSSEEDKIKYVESQGVDITETILIHEDRRDPSRRAVHAVDFAMGRLERFPDQLQVSCIRDAAGNLT